ncbi:MAG: NADH-quinone oxidoreductase subunit H [Candidatus Micrarchaeota archaeon]|nr:NADH-quinone oxidoreductase subunit H [Candidatus Micrarchaeota archaeon]
MEISSPFIGTFFAAISSLLSNYLNGTALAAVSVLAALVIFLIALSIIIIAFSYLFSWLERKVVARAHGRHGPTYVGPFGFLQNLADFVKLLSKEHIVPSSAERPLFTVMLPLMFGLFVIIMAFIPFTNAFVGINTSLALLAVFVLLSFSPLLMFLIGWTSGNKFSSISAQRSVIILVSYEIPMFLVVLAVAMLAGSFSLGSIVGMQNTGWFALSMPIGIVVFFIVLLAELERPPFDLRDADSELIAGWLVEVSAPYYLISLMLDYTRVLVGSLLVSILFLGGWLGPAPIPPFVWLMLKVALLTIFIMVIRATTVRMRMDRVLRLGWAYLMPLAVANLLITFMLFIR